LGYCVVVLLGLLIDLLSFNYDWYDYSEGLWDRVLRGIIWMGLMMVRIQD